MNVETPNFMWSMAKIYPLVTYPTDEKHPDPILESSMKPYRILDLSLLF